MFFPVFISMPLLMFSCELWQWSSFRCYLPSEEWPVKVGIHRASHAFAQNPAKEWGLCFVKSVKKSQKR